MTEWVYGEPIAVRELERSGEPVTVSIGRPYQQDQSWFCPYMITGLTDEPVVHYRGGVDAVQALWAALRTVGVDLDAANRDGAGVTFAGTEDLGFPGI